MHKVLFVHEEQNIDRALKDVLCLLDYEKKYLKPYETVDLLGIILTPHTDDLVVSMATGSDVPELSSSFISPFNHQFVSMNGTWTMLTIHLSDPADAAHRHLALSQVIHFMNASWKDTSIRAVLPVHFPEEAEQAVAEREGYLRQQHPGIPIKSSLVMGSI